MKTMLCTLVEQYKFASCEANKLFLMAQQHTFTAFSLRFWVLERMVWPLFLLCEELAFFFLIINVVQA
jgi:hypothetical protein